MKAILLFAGIIFSHGFQPALAKDSNIIAALDQYFDKSTKNMIAQSLVNNMLAKGIDLTNVEQKDTIRTFKRGRIHRATRIIKRRVEGLESNEKKQLLTEAICSKEAAAYKNFLFGDLTLGLAELKKETIKTYFMEDKSIPKKQTKPAKYMDQFMHSSQLTESNHIFCEKHFPVKSNCFKKSQFSACVSYMTAQTAKVILKNIKKKEMLLLTPFFGSTTQELIDDYFINYFTN